MISFRKVFVLGILMLAQLSCFSSNAVAQNYDKDFSASVDRVNCLTALLKNNSVFISPDIAALNIGTSQAMKIEQKLKVLLEEFIEVAGSINVQASSEQYPDEYTAYSSSVIAFSSLMNMNSLVSDYEAYGPIKANDSLFKFNARAGDRVNNETITYTYDFALPGNGNISDCNSVCMLYLENIVLARLWSKLWNVNSAKPIAQSLAKIRSAKAEYDYFFFEAGDGLYPWELWVNSLGKSNDILSPPKGKINLLHPSPIVYYDNLQGNIEPSMIVEVVGYTQLNYSQSGSLPIGASLAETEMTIGVLG